MKRYLRNDPEKMLAIALRPRRQALRRAGLREEALRKMKPEERVAALEQAKLDPYDFIFLAC